MNEGRIIAVGDLHGCSVALAKLIEVIRPTALATLVFLGDYIDRGPDSKGVIEQVIRLAEQCQVVPLLGNHEEMLLGALEEKDNLRFWLKLGGRAALDSYAAGDDVPKIPQAHIEFIRGCRNYFEPVHHIFVHAFYEPDLPLHQQKWEGLRWASLPPDPKPHCSGKVAIVGHTAQKSGEILDLGCVVCIDTFCQGGGWLTALEVETGQVWQVNEAGVVRWLGGTGRRLAGATLPGHRRIADPESRHPVVVVDFRGRPVHGVCLARDARGRGVDRVADGRLRGGGEWCSRQDVLAVGALAMVLVSSEERLASLGRQ
jgi:serine/threonine protein phosphatase 1